MNPIIIVTGIPGSGKSTAVNDVIIPQLNRAGYTTEFWTDKHVLDQYVAEDVHIYQPTVQRFGSDGALIGDHSILYNPGADIGLFRLQLLDGTLLNQAHTYMLRYADQVRLDPQVVLVMELAYGKDVTYDGREPLLQSGAQFARWFEEFGLRDRIRILDIVSSVDDRLVRNRARSVHHVPTTEFMHIFPDDGHFTRDDMAVFGPNYHRIENNGIKQEELIKFRKEVEMYAESLVVQQLDQEHESSRGVEGSLF